MKRVWMRAACLAVLLVAMTTSVLAQEVMRVYVSETAMERETARELTALLGREFPQAEFALLEDGAGLRELVLSDCAPQLAICPPGEALVWAKEGLTLPLQKRIGDQEKIAREILSVCVHEEDLFMAPLIAHHRQMAVNVKLMEKKALGYMLDEIAHPVWYPTEFQQILEEFVLADAQAIDVWKPDMQSGAAVEALVQAIYCASLLGEDGVSCEADSEALQAGMRWLRVMINNGMVGYQPSRQAALDRFIAGETAIFLDWTQSLQKQYAQKLKDAGIVLETRPYPSSSGLPVRAYELMGVSVFDSGEAEKNALALQAAAFLHEDAGAQRILGTRGILRDDSVWLWDLEASDRGATLRSLFHQAFEEIMDAQQDIEQALQLVKAGMDTAR